MPSRAALTCACFCLFLAGTAEAQTYRAPQTSAGQPDLQGVWTSGSHTPFQRPAVFTGPTATPEQESVFVSEREAALTGTTPPSADGEPSPLTDAVGGVESEWYEGRAGLMRIDGQRRTSIITHPADGRLPYNTYGARAAADALVRDDTAMGSAEERHTDERCLMGSGSSVGPPMLPSGQNQHYQIIQTPDTVVIHVEMIHDVRIIRIGGEHASGPPRWMGDSVGRWDGDTLVIETINQHPLSAVRFVGPGILQITPGAKVVERLTRTAPNELRYAFTVEDPAVYAEPWNGELVFRPTNARMFEYACHEGNYALPNILRGARRQEQEAARILPAKPAALTATPKDTP